MLICLCCPSRPSRSPSSTPRLCWRATTSSSSTCCPTQPTCHATPRTHRRRGAGGCAACSRGHRCALLHEPAGTQQQTGAYRAPFTVANGTQRWQRLQAPPKHCRTHRTRRIIVSPDLPSPRCPHARQAVIRTVVAVKTCTETPLLWSCAVLPARAGPQNQYSTPCTSTPHTLHLDTPTPPSPPRLVAHPYLSNPTLPALPCFTHTNTLLPPSPSPAPPAGGARRCVAPPGGDVDGGAGRPHQRVRGRVAQLSGGHSEGPGAGPGRRGECKRAPEWG